MRAVPQGEFLGISLLQLRLLNRQHNCQFVSIKAMSDALKSCMQSKIANAVAG